MPSLEPTFEPEPTVPGALPLRTEVEVNTSITDRRGVPSDLYDTYWWTEYGDAGQVGTTAQIGLPADEGILTAGTGLVVSERPKNETTPVHILVREIRTGALVLELDTALLGVRAVLVGRRLFWAGPQEYSDAKSIDGGVWTVDLDGPDPPRAIIEPGEDVTALGDAGRTPLFASPSGRTVASAVGGFSGRFTDIIDVKTMKFRTRLSGEVVLALTDDVAITSDEPPTDAPSGWIKAVDIKSGSALWHFPALDQRETFSLYKIRSAGSTFVGEFTRRSSEDLVVALFDPLDGQRQRLLIQPQGPNIGKVFHLVASLTGARHAVLSDSFDSASDIVLEPGSAASTLDLKTGELVRDAFVLDTPWRCYPEYCLRN